MTALVLPNHRRMIAAAKRAAAKWFAIPMSADPAIVSARGESNATAQTRRRAVQYAVWLAERDCKLSHPSREYTGDYDGAGKVTLARHTGDGSPAEYVEIRIPNWNWQPAPLAIETRLDVEPIGAISARAPSAAAGGRLAITAPTGAPTAPRAPVAPAGDSFRIPTGWLHIGRRRAAERRYS